MPKVQRRTNLTVQELVSPLKSRAARRSARLKLAVRICWLIVLAGFILWKVFDILRHYYMLTFIVVGGVLFAYLIFPVVRRLNTRMGIGWAIAAVYVGIVLLLAGALYTVVPALSHDVQKFIRNGPTFVAQAQLALIKPHSAIIAHLPVELRDYLATLPSQIESYVVGHTTKFMSTVLPVLISIVAVGALFIAVPVVAAYLLLEASDLKQTMLGFVPEHRQAKARKVIADLDEVVGGFIRGQLLVALIVGVLVTLLLLGLHIQYAFLIGAAAGILDVIPYVGAVAGWLPAFLIAIFNNGFDSAIYVTVGIIVINQLEGHIISPNVVSKTVGLTPLAVILALIAGGEIAGLPGLLLAVPAAGALRVLIVNFRPTPATVAEAQPALSKSSHKRPLLFRLWKAMQERRHRR